jgi:hypothetical protein
MKRVSVTVPENILHLPDGADEQLERESQFLLTLKLFEMGRVSTEQAASMCGMPSVDFLLAAERSNRPGSPSAHS